MHTTRSNKMFSFSRRSFLSYTLLLHACVTIARLDAMSLIIIFQTRCKRTYSLFKMYTYVIICRVRLRNDIVVKVLTAGRLICRAYLLSVIWVRDEFSIRSYKLLF